MKVQNEFSSSVDNEEKHLKIKSKYTLRFLDKSLEEEFNEIIMTEISNTIGINRKESLVIYILSYMMVLIIYLLSYIISFLKEDSMKNSLIFQIISIVSVSLFTSLVYIFSQSINALSPKVKDSFSIVIYILTCEVIILNCNNIQNKIFGINSNSELQTILGILPLFYTSKFVIFKNFLEYLLSNTFISISFIALNLGADNKNQSVIFEFFILFFVSLFEAQNFYTREKKAREKFISIQNYLSPLKQTSKFSGPKTDIEEISQTIKDTLRMISSPKTNSTDKVSMEKIFNNLTKVLGLIGNRNSVYSIDLDLLSNQIDDDDDKVFIQETCAKAAKPMLRASTKFYMRKTVDVLKNYEFEELSLLLKRVGKEWNFDTFFVRDCTKNKPLATIGCFCMKRYKIDTVFNIPEIVYSFFFKTTEELYKLNPYHNSSHASDVLCSFLFLMQQSILSDFLQDIELFAAIIATLCHDIGHPGLTNRFLVNTKDELALTCNKYLDNDISVLEMMHCSTIYKIIKDPNCNIFSTLNSFEEKMIRGLIIEMILCTDMSKHFDIIGKFKAKLMNNDSVQLQNYDQRIEIMNILMKASDVGHAAKSNILHQMWSKLVIEEFFFQGDMEKQKGLAVSMYCDRDTTDISKSQTGFIKNIVMPIYEAIDMGLKSVRIKECCIEQLESNMLNWEYSYNKRQRGMTQTEKIEHKKIKKKRLDFTLKSNNKQDWFT